MMRQLTRCFHLSFFFFSLPKTASLCYASYLVDRASIRCLMKIVCIEENCFLKIFNLLNLLLQGSDHHIRLSMLAQLHLLWTQ